MRTGPVYRRLFFYLCLPVLLATGCGKPSPDEIFEEGLQLEAQRNFVSARHRFEELVRSYPDYPLIPLVRLHIGLCHLQDRNIGDAKTVFTEILSDYPGTQHAWMANVRLGDIAKSEKNYDKAREYYQAAIDSATAPELVLQPMSQLSMAYLESEQIPLAIDTMKRMADIAQEPRAKLRTVQELANVYLTSGSPEEGWATLVGIKDATGIDQLPKQYMLSVRQTAFYTKFFDRGFEFFSDIAKSSTDENLAALALYNKAMLAASTDVHRATGVATLLKVRDLYPETEYGRWAEVEAARTILASSDEFENARDRAEELLDQARDNYDDIIKDMTTEWFEPAKAAMGWRTLADVYEIRAQWLENVDDLKEASRALSEIPSRFQNILPQLAFNARQQMHMLGSMIEVAEASPESFWDQIRYVRRGIPPPGAATPEADISAATTEAIASELASTPEEDSTEGDSE